MGIANSSENIEDENYRDQWNEPKEMLVMSPPTGSQYVKDNSSKPNTL